MYTVRNTASKEVSPQNFNYCIIFHAVSLFFFFKQSLTTRSRIFLLHMETHVNEVLGQI